MDIKWIYFLMLQHGTILGQTGDCRKEPDKEICVNAYVGTDTVLVCPLKERSTFPTWIRHDSSNQTIIATDNKISSLPGKMALSDLGNTTYNLTIFNVTKKDEGKYCCVTFGPENVVEFCSNLRIKDEPYVPPTDLNKEVCVNNAVSLPCSYLSSPNMPNVTHIYWMKDGEPLNFINDRITGSTLSHPPIIINNASVDDSGLYQCQVVSSAGDLQGDAIKLRVKNFLSIVPTEDVIDTTEDSNITLRCDYESCLMVPISEVFWTKRLIKRKDNDIQRTIIQRSVSKPSLLMHRVNVYDSGIYTCHVKAASYTAIGEDILLLVKVIIIGAAVGGVMALLLSIFGITILALRLHFRSEMSLNNRHQNTASNPPGIDESQQSRENTPEENVENDQSTNNMINAYDEIDETQMTGTSESSVDASTPILTNTPRRYENTVLTFCPEASARQHEHTVLTPSRGALDDQNLVKRQQSKLEQHIVPEQCEQKRIIHNVDNGCFGLNNLQVLEYEEPFTTLKNAMCDSSHVSQDTTNY